MKANLDRPIRYIACIGAGLLLAITLGCTTNESSAGSKGMNQVYGKAFQATGAAICLQKMIKDPPAPFHLSFTEKSSSGETSNVEADVTPTAIDYTLRDSSRGKTTTKERHLAKDQITELDIDFGIMGPVPWHGELAPVQSTTKPAGSERVNGYDTTRYSFDTAHEPAAEKSTFLTLLRAKDYSIIGSAWTTKDRGCLVKWALDLHEDGKDGSVKQTHYEGNVTKR